MTLYQVLSSPLIDNHKHVIDNFELAAVQECQLNGAETREVKDNS